MPTLAERVSLFWRTFTPVEHALLQGVISALSPAQRELAKQQVEAVTRTQRLLDWTDTSFYSIHWGKVSWPDEALFPNRGVFQLATLEFVIGGQSFSGSLWCVGGHVFSLVIRPSIKASSFQAIERLAVSVVGRPDLVSLNGPDFSHLLPSSYIAFCKSNSPLHQSDWQIAEPSEVHLVHLSSGDFLFLAQRDSDFLLANGLRRSESIYHCLSGEEPRAIGTSFTDAVLQWR